MVHAVSGALQPGVEPKVRGTDRYRAIGDRHAMRDVYGRDGRVDIYSGREMVQYYMATSFGKNQPFCAERPSAMALMAKGRGSAGASPQDDSASVPLSFFP